MGAFRTNSKRAIIASMKSRLVPEILSAEKIDEDVLVSFSDGKHAIFSAAVLYSTLYLTNVMSHLHEENESMQQARQDGPKYMA